MTLTESPATPPRGARPVGWFAATVDGSGRVVLSGELDMSGLEALRSALDQALDGPGEVLNIDASQLSFIDSSAVGELLRYQLIAGGRRRRLRLEQVSSPVAMVLDVLELRHLLTTNDPGTAAADGTAPADDGPA